MYILLIRQRQCGTDFHAVTLLEFPIIHYTSTEESMLWIKAQEMSDIRIKEVHGMKISNTYAILENVESKIVMTTAIK
jgi:hypothetical protein